MADEAAERRAGARGQRLGVATLVLRLVQPDLDQLVHRERLVDRAQHALVDPGLTHDDDGLERVRAPAQRLALARRELRGGGGDHGWPRGRITDRRPPRWLLASRAHASTLVKEPRTMPECDL